MRRLGEIIMADDNGNDVSLVSYALKDAGLKNPIEWIKDGKGLMEYLNRNLLLDQIPLLIVMDWNMPGCNAVELLKWIRNQPRFLNVLIVVLTGSENPAQKRLAYDAGANWHLVKTAAFADLTRLISSVVGFWSTSSLLPNPD
jgi:CheY-like chemotaxis protein